MPPISCVQINVIFSHIIKIMYGLLLTVIHCFSDPWLVWLSTLVTCFMVLPGFLHNVIQLKATISQKRDFVIRNDNLLYLTLLLWCAAPYPTSVSLFACIYIKLFSCKSLFVCIKIFTFKSLFAYIKLFTNFFFKFPKIMFPRISRFN